MAGDPAAQDGQDVTARITEAQAAKLGLIKAPKARKTRVAEPRARARSTCVACGEAFTTTAAEDRHVSAGHNRFASDIS